MYIISPLWLCEASISREDLRLTLLVTGPLRTGGIPHPAIRSEPDPSQSEAGFSPPFLGVMSGSAEGMGTRLDTTPIILITFRALISLMRDERCDHDAKSFVAPISAMLGQSSIRSH